MIYKDARHIARVRKETQCLNVSSGYIFKCVYIYILYIYIYIYLRLYEKLKLLMIDGINKGGTEVSAVAQWDQHLLCSAGTQVGSPAWHRGLKDLALPQVWQR